MVDGKVESGIRVGETMKEQTGIAEACKAWKRPFQPLKETIRVFFIGFFAAKLWSVEDAEEIVVSFGRFGWSCLGGAL